MSLALPPLPDFGGPAPRHPAGTDAVTALTAEHDRLLALCTALAADAPGQNRYALGQSKDALGQSEDALGQSKDALGQSEDALGQSKDAPDPDKPDRVRTAQVVTACLARHLSAEEQYLYPAIRAAVPHGAELADREVAEDHAIVLLLQQLDGVAPDDAEFDRLAGGLRELMHRHARCAADELLPSLAAAGTPEDLVRLGDRLALAAEAAPTRPHPGTPDRPPWNKVVDPAIGVWDKARDAFSGRVTYPQDL